MKRLAVVLLNGCYASSAVQLLDFARLAAACSDDPRAQIECDIVAPAGAQTRLTEGFAITPTASIDTTNQYDLVFVPALDYPDSATFLERLASYKPVYAWLERQWHAGAIIASLATGVFVIAEAGLLDRRLATTSWWLEKQLHRCYPAVKLDITRDITESDRIVCGSSISVGSQLSLELIEMLTSPAIAAALAGSIVFDTDRDVAAFESNYDLVGRAQAWFRKNLSNKIRLAEVARSLAVSERTLIRHFKKELGVTPHAFLQGVRIDAAKALLCDTNLGIARIAERVGYSDVAFFQQVFRSHVGMSPTVFRKNSASGEAIARPNA